MEVHASGVLPRSLERSRPVSDPTDRLFGLLTVPDLALLGILVRNMKFEFEATTVGTRLRLEGPVIDWAKGLGERNVARMELYRGHRCPRRRPTLPVLVVTLVNGSLYLIQRTARHSPSTNNDHPTTTIEGATTLNFSSRPIIVVTFKRDVHLDLCSILYACCNVPKLPNSKPKFDSRSFGLTVLLNITRYVLDRRISLSSGSSLQAKSLLGHLWKDAYQVAQRDDYDFWDKSLVDRTKNIVRELIYTMAYNALKKKLNWTGEDFMKEAYSTVAHVEVTESAENSPSDKAWDQAWNKHTKLTWRFLIRWLVVGNSLRRLSSQTDERDLPRRCKLTGFATDTKLVHFGLVGRDWNKITPGLKCSRGPQTGADCDCHAWISDWQIANHLAWNEIWPKAFQAGMDAVEGSIRDFRGQQRPVYANTSAATDGTPEHAPHVTQVIINPQPRQPQGNAGHNRTHPRAYPKSSQEQAVEGVTRFIKWLWARLEKSIEKEETAAQEVSQSALMDNNSAPNELIYHLLKADARKNANKALNKARHTENSLNRNPNTKMTHGNGHVKLYIDKMATLFKKNGGGLLSHKTLEDIHKETWSNSWGEIWADAWDDAYRSARTKGIEFGVKVALAKSQGACTHGQLVGQLMSKESYQGIQRNAENEDLEVGGILDYVHSLFKDLSYTSNLASIHNTYNSDVAIRALVPNKDQNLNDISRILPKQPVSRELSYLELRHFIMDEYFKEELWKHRTSFQFGVSHAWQSFLKLQSDEAGRP
ncbi:hypothetical protein RHS01_08956 [Rhizoctonia solani]|uniref:Uncharacterized protein n=1 Tax=Rhizoctonia solani TaxID=456999 RepID=A0A8H7I7S9_9AGAM|nr:hypothetical protein RHS01_08956 [Rhizoctonia solani]